MPGKQTANQKFIQQAAPSYLNALVAVNAFEQEIQNRCKKVLVTHLPALEKAMKLKLNPLKVEFHPTWDKWKELDPDFSASLSASLELNDPRGEFRRLYSGLDWESDGSVYASTTFELRTSKFTDLLFEKLDGKIQKFSDPQKGYYLYACEDVPLDRADVFEDKLEETLRVWAKAWSTAGGLSAVFKK
mgnify:FL=1